MAGPVLLLGCGVSLGLLTFIMLVLGFRRFIAGSCFFRKFCLSFICTRLSNSVVSNNFIIFYFITDSIYRLPEDHFKIQP